MEFDRDKVDEVTLALLWLTRFKQAGAVRAWKGHDFDTMDRLYSKNFIFDPRGDQKSVVLTEEGEKQSKRLFEKYFTS
ncbi:DUF6429 family protein [Occallatibacter savannae]|uniref:DUF6429 family protein n=1 Tax=Occallatibacter savannae TaxID=1002691 RepID=UPI000D691C3B|nr:DUF6429 family protein [Occallatibacter savannae]